MSHESFCHRIVARTRNRFRRSKRGARGIPSRITTARRPLTAPTSITSHRGTARIQLLNDPDRRIDLVSVSGWVDLHLSLELDRICQSITSSGIHLDLHEALIPDVQTMSHLELAIDRIEARGLQIRVDGVDPMHPALVA